MASALDGIRVIDQTQVMAGPTATMLLGDLGADVIKVEPLDGETTRGMDPRLSKGVSAAFVAVNRNKRSLALALKHARGVEVFRRLVGTSDVLVENYRPGVAKRLGVDYDALSALNPRLVYCSISGFGQTGPYASRGGYDLVAQGMSGIMSVTGNDGGPPVKVGVPIADLGAAPATCRSASARRIVSTRPTRRSAQATATSRSVPPTTSSGRSSARCSDGTTSCAIRGSTRSRDGSGIASSSSVRSRARRRRSRAPTGSGAARRPAFPAGPINTVPEAHADPQAQARGMVPEVAHPDAGRVKALGNPVKLSKSPARLGKAAPRLGEDTRAILRELGYVDSEVDILGRERAVG